MISIDRQVHGYKQGHQLLASSVTLPKNDQSILDRLSDVAGPLRPGEKFAPYISAYPLPSGKRYVLARTWQDLSVARAGCVRTLSLIINSSDWGVAKNLVQFFEALDLPFLPQETDATEIAVSPTSKNLPEIHKFPHELIEALFLEEPQPVAVFDAQLPELITVRLLSALWPSLRKKFAVSTFALSPRKVSGRDFDLVFAPKDSRSRFSDWVGRRVDGRSSKEARHRWTNEIASRIFLHQEPHLLLQSEVEIFGEDDSGDANSTKLRLALLWRELFAKVATTPTAALGLLDIASSGKLDNRAAINTIEPYLQDAIKRATLSLPEEEVWNFLTAIARKIEKYSLNAVALAVANAAEDLAGAAPEGALALLTSASGKGVALTLLPKIAKGLGNNFTSRAEQSLLNAPEELLGQLIAQGGKLAKNIAVNERLIARLAEILPRLDDFLLDKASDQFLPLLVEDFQAVAAAPLISRLDADGLVKKVINLGEANDFNAGKLTEFVLSRAVHLGAQSLLRDCLMLLPPTRRRDSFIAKVLSPSLEDLTWLLTTSLLGAKSATSIFVNIIRRSNSKQIVEVISSPFVGDRALHILARFSRDVLEQVLYNERLPVKVLVGSVISLLKDTRHPLSVNLSKKVIQKFFQTRLSADEHVLLTDLVWAVGENIDTVWLSGAAFGCHVEASFVSRNMITISSMQPPVRKYISRGVVDIAKALHERAHLDLNSKAADALSSLIVESELHAPDSALEASAYLLPMAINEVYAPVSSIVVVAFPHVYKEVARNGKAPFLYQLFNFFDWDHCKTLREQLVSAFMSSSWPPSDLALTAWKAGATDRVMRRVSKQMGGVSYLNRMLVDLSRLPKKCRNDIEKSVYDALGDK